MPGQDDSNAHLLPGHEPAGVYVSLAEAAALTGQHPEALRAKARRGASRRSGAMMARGVSKFLLPGQRPGICPTKLQD
jgi:hypothetical protein